MIVYAPALDWLTLSESLKTTSTTVLYSFVKGLCRPGRFARRIGYVGKTWEFPQGVGSSYPGTLFYGERNWKDTDWGLLVASGESAHNLMHFIWLSDELQWHETRCTRLDVQITIPWPEHPFYLRHLVLTGGVKASVVHGISEGDEWAETLYLGSRSSPVLVRAYRKRIDDSSHDWLRVEVEYKRQASKRLFQEIVSDGRVANWFQPVEERCPSLYEMIDPYLRDDPGKPVIQREQGNTIKWLSTTVANCVCRLLADDDYSEQVTELVAQWFQYSLSCQNRRTDV